METEKRNPLAITAGILYCLLFFITLFSFESGLLRDLFSEYQRYALRELIPLLSYTFIAFALFLKPSRISKKVKCCLMGCGFGLICLNIIISHGIWGFLTDAFCSSYGFCDFLSVAAFLFAAVCSSLTIKKDSNIRKLWWIPGVLYSSSFILSVIDEYQYSFFDQINNIVFSFETLVFFIQTLALMLTMAQVAYPEGKVTVKENGYFSLFGHILLLLFSFGIWWYIWIWRTTAVLNDPEQGEMHNPMTKTLLCLFVPFYTIYWMYKSAERCDRKAQRKELPSNIATICLILAIFFPLIPPILIQDKINSIARRPVMAATVPSMPSATVDTVNATADAQLIRLKGLLDAGVITKQEFEEKRKELLGF